MSGLTIAEMMEQVPEGKARVFERTIEDPCEECYFKVMQNWDYPRDRLEWLNFRGGAPNGPWVGTRRKPRTPLSTLSPPDVRFDGPSEDVVDFHSTGSHAFLISDKLFSLIEQMDPGSLEHVTFELHTKDGDLPFHVVMPNRVLEAIDTRRTTVQIQDEPLGERFSRTVKLYHGICFNNEILEGVASFSDFDAPGWYWSKDLLAEAKSRRIRGLYAKSIASSQGETVERL
jgi:hypothetical protein